MSRSSIIFSFLIISLTVILGITLYEAYSVYISLQESSIQPLPRRTSIQYVFSKQGSSNVFFAEVRSISLSTSGTTITSARITWYRRFPIWIGYYVTVKVSLKDDYGNTISSGTSGTVCYIRSGLVTSDIDLVPDVNIDSVARVETSIDIGGVCWELLLTVEPTESIDESGEEQA
ncbi:MAG: hypothetical protein QXF08_05265 [Nitrososphaerota archaeon]